ncbi:uncharacterized protein [Palaemon carinicauda]|uniref:uncharacterized protein n=1 Tax=Palaemon carinicauda TaxID=392227 RepID=UPI0035B68956
MAKSIKFADVCKLHLLWIPLFLLYGTAKVADSTNIWIANGITQKCLQYTTKISVSERNVLACSFRAIAHGATLFGYNDKNCLIYKETMATYNSTMKFQRVESACNLEEIARRKPAAYSYQTYFGSPEAAYAVDGERRLDFTFRGLIQIYIGL